MATLVVTRVKELDEDKLQVELGLPVVVESPTIVKWMTWVWPKARPRLP